MISRSSFEILSGQYLAWGLKKVDFTKAKPKIKSTKLIKVSILWTKFNFLSSILLAVLNFEFTEILSNAAALGGIN